MAALTRWALEYRMLILLLVVLLIVGGPYSFVSHPSREDPTITIRTAVVTATVPGMSPARIENLLTRKLEEKIREIPEVQNISSVSRTGQTIIKVELYDRYFDLDPIWTDLRNKMEDVKPELPSGTQGPHVNDNYGAVAMATVALTGDGFSLHELEETADEIKRGLYKVEGVSKVELYGVEPERIYIEFNGVRLAALGLTTQSVATAIMQTNVVSPGGRIEANNRTFIVEPTGNFNSLDAIRDVTIAVPGKPGQVIYLRDLAEIKRGYVDPRQRPVLFNGRPAVVLAVEMVERFDSDRFGRNLKQAVQQLENGLPIGYELEFITFQPDDITRAISNVMSNLYQTVTIVLLVVIAFLGLRSGIIVGTMIPLTMLMTLLVMRYIGVELERMSLASLIIALGLLVDNGIVMVEEIGRRIDLGDSPRTAAVESGRTLGWPLLASSLTTIVAFTPLMLAENEAGEYTRSLSLVIAIALMSSWILAMVVTPVFSYWNLKPSPTEGEKAGVVQARYREILEWILANRVLFLGVVFGALIIALWALRFVPNVFFPASDRTQLQVYIDLPVGSNTYGTIAVSERLSRFLADKERNPDVGAHVIYVADGGPRFYLALNPIDPEPHRAFGIVNITSLDRVESVRRGIIEFAHNELPESRVTVKRMSMGPSESGLVEYRLIGPDSDVLIENSHRLQDGMRRIPGTVDIRDDWENPVVKIVIDIDQARARRVGVTTESVAETLNATLSGVAVTDFREGDDIIPIYVRAEGEERTNLDRLRMLNVNVGGASPVPLVQVADVYGAPEFAIVHRRNLEQVVTVSGKHLTMSAAMLDETISNRVLADPALPAGYRLERGGEIEKSAEAQSALAANMPLALALILMILVWQFKGYRKALMILSVIPLTLSGVTTGLLIMPGATMSFVGTLGLLSLAGIIINNAIVLIDRIDLERQAGASLEAAIVSASLLRLRPIMMTTVTTVLGLLPLMVFHDILFYDLAVVLSGGLIVGTLLTLGVVPVLYSYFFANDRVTNDPIEAGKDA